MSATTWPNGKPGNKTGYPWKGNRKGTRWRGKIPVPNCHRAVMIFRMTCNEEMTSLTEIANRIRMKRATVTQWGIKVHPRVDELEAALNVLGLELFVRPKRDDQ